MYLIHVIFSWLLDQRSVVAGTLGFVVFGICLVLRYGFGIWWPAGIVLATICGVVAMITSATE